MILLFTDSDKEGERKIQVFSTVPTAALPSPLVDTCKQ